VSPSPDSDHLRVLIANQRPQRLDHVTTIVASLGHEVIARSIEVEDVAGLTARERPDVALVGLGESSQQPDASPAYPQKKADIPLSESRSRTRIRSAKRGARDTPSERPSATGLGLGSGTGVWLSVGAFPGKAPQL
jgi:hypothetical protein